MRCSYWLTAAFIQKIRSTRKRREGIGWGEDREGREVEDMGVKELWTKSPFRGPKIVEVLYNQYL